MLKDRLLETNYFIDNIYLEKYIWLVQKNINTSPQAQVTNIHHIIPKAYYRLSNLEVDNSKENLVNLSYTNHILVHYYLCLCTKGKLKQSQLFAFFSLVSRKWSYKNFNPETDLKYYQSLLKLKNKQISKSNKGRKRSDEFRLKRSLYMKGRKLPASSEKKFKKVICIETQQIFNSLIDADKWIGASIIHALKHYNNQQTVKGYHWAYLDDIQTQNKLKEFIGKNPHKRKYIKVKCVELDLDFNSIAEATNWLLNNNKRGYIVGCLRNEQETAGGYHWIKI